MGSLGSDCAGRGLVVDGDCTFGGRFVFGTSSGTSIGSEEGIWGALERFDAFDALEDCFRGVRSGDLKGLWRAESRRRRLNGWGVSIVSQCCVQEVR